MRPNSRETTACRVCEAPIFFAVTKGGERQPLDVEPHPEGNVMAYRGVRFWLARTLPRARPEQAGEQLELGAVAEMVDDPREHPPHPLERTYRPHAQTCAGGKPGQVGLFDVSADGPPDQRPPVATTPAKARRAAETPRRPSPLIYNVKNGASGGPSAEHGEEARVFDWSTAAPRIAARRRAARPAAGA